MTSPGRARELAELSGVPLGRAPLPIGRVAVPAALSIENGRLTWNRQSEMSDEDATGVLDQFIKIEKADDVLSFARRFGVLGLWLGSEWDQGEPVADWLRLASSARAVIEIASYLHGDARPRPDERVAAWRVLLLEDLGFSFRDQAEVDDRSRLLADSSKRNLAVQRLAEYVNFKWLDVGRARPVLALVHQPDGYVHRLELRGTGTFGVLAIQLATAVAKAHDIYVCDGCAMSYLRTERPPQPGRRNYCPDCKGNGIDERDRKRQQRAAPKKRRARRGDGHGKKK